MPIAFINGDHTSNISITDMLTGKIYNLGKVDEITPTSNEDNEFSFVDARVLRSIEPITFTVMPDKPRFKALAIFALTGNDLYLRFPKKLRRRRRRNE